MTVAEITVIGHLGKNPEMKYLPSGKAVTNFSVATTRKWKDNSNQEVKETTWFRISVFDKVAENCNKYLVKGSQVYVKGRLNVDNETGGPRLFKRQDGSMGSSYEITAQDVRFLGSKGDHPSDSPEEGSSASSSPDIADDGFPL